jgi:hypothetical protein
MQSKPKKSGDANKRSGPDCLSKLNIGLLVTEKVKILVVLRTKGSYKLF